MPTLLTFDADWGVNPTPLAVTRGWWPAETRTPEMLVYAYAPGQGERPDPARHQVFVPRRVYRAFQQAGLPLVDVACSRMHGDLRRVWPPALLAHVTRLVVCDAHLDLYPVLPVEAPEAAAPLFDVTLPQLCTPERRAAVCAAARRLQPHVAWEPRVAGLWEWAWNQGWLYLWLPQLPRLTTVEWIVPEHFPIATQFPYAEAHWLETLEVGQARQLWTYLLDIPERRVWLRIRPWELLPQARRLEVRLLKLAALTGLADVVGPVHVCLSPEWTPPTADAPVLQLLQWLSNGF